MEGARDVQQELRRRGCAFFLPERRCRQSLTAQRANRKGGTQPDHRRHPGRGGQRVPRFETRSGLTRLVTVPVSRASADQRRGRAGRIGPGVCLRLWSREMHHTLIPAHRPEILEADLAGLALELALWGVADPGKLKWLDPLPRNTFDSACDLLRSL